MKQERFADLLNRLDPHPGVRGRQFERICAWYLRNAPEYRGRFKHVWLWTDWPGAWAPDAGIDPVAEEQDGSRPETKIEIRSWCSEGGCTTVFSG